MKRGTSKPPGKSTLALLLLLAAAAVAARAQGDDGIIYKPLRFGGVQEFGAIVEGRVANDGGVLSSSNPKLSNEWVDHFGAFLSQEVIVDERLNLQLGLGGIFQFPKSEHVIPKYGSSMYKMFFVGPSVAKAMYSFGNPEKPSLVLGGGLFPYKYNPDAADLGEYLFRANPYPTTIFTGGLLFVNDNAAYVQGFHARLRLGNFRVDALLASETVLPPLYDWSLGFVAHYPIADGLIDLGAGVNFKRLIPIDPDRTRIKGLQNAFFTRNGSEYYADPAYYQNQATFYYNKNTSADSTKANGFQATVDSMGSWLNPASASYVQEGERGYYSPAGVVLMARASLDLKKLTGLETGRAPFKVFAEGALLGVKNHPVFYEDRMRRVPLMVGAHVPTFGLLDQATLQFEWFDSPWSNNTYNMGYQNTAVPYLPSGTEPLFSRDEYNDVTDHDNYSWAILLRRELYPHLNLSAQIARDHLRTVGTNWFYGGRLEPGEVLYRNSNWYWMTQLAWGF